MHPMYQTFWNIAIPTLVLIFGAWVVQKEDGSEA